MVVTLTLIFSRRGRGKEDEGQGGGLRSLDHLSCSPNTRGLEYYACPVGVSITSAQGHPQNASNGLPVSTLPMKYGIDTNDTIFVGHSCCSNYSVLKHPESWCPGN